MILNDKEKAELITLFKKQYNTRKEMFEKGELYWLKTEEDKENFIRETEELKERYETLENMEVCEISLNPDFFKSNNNSNWVWGVIMLALLFGCGGNNPEDNSNLN